MSPSFIHRAAQAGLAGAIACTLAACGGSSSSDPVVVTPPVVTPTSLMLTGTAATGKALSTRPVLATCATGTGSATSLADGSYTLSVSGGALPCVVKVTAADGTVLHSVASGSGNTAVVNISPLTELVVAQAAGGKAATLFASFDAAAQAKVSSAALATATTAVATALQSVLSLSGINPFTDTLVAANGNSAGNALDTKLDTLTAALASAQLTVADLGSAIVANGGAAAAVVASQVKPAAATCASARSGDYWVINPNETLAANRLQKVAFNATALTITRADGTVSGSAVPTAGKPCQFSADSGRSTVVVSPTGVIINRYLANDGSNTPLIAVLVPAQAVALADLAGTWNTVEFSRDNGASNPNVNSYAQVVVDAAGKLTAVADCKQLLPCVAHTVPTGFTANAAGGFDVVDTDGGLSRLFAFRAASGEMAMVGLFPQGVMVGSKQVAVSTAVVGTANPFWDMWINANGVASTIAENTSTILSVNSAAGTYTRSLKADGRVDTFAINSPRPGLRNRAANACTTSSGAAATCSAIIVMPLPAFGMAVYGSAVASNPFFGLSVNMPAGSVTNASTVVEPVTNSAALGTLVVSNGESYVLRASLVINSAGQITGGQYDFHTTTGTLTACTHSTANDATCFGANTTFVNTTQGGALTTAGSASTIAVTAGPDIYGYTFTGTLTGRIWTGTATKVATAQSAGSGASGVFSVELGITQN